MQTALTRGEAERDMTDKRALTARKKNRANNTGTPRTRDGQTYPGGKTMRKALARLAARKNGFVAQSRKPHQRTLPGSMSK